jgi:hypothetical protein
MFINISIAMSTLEMRQMLQVYRYFEAIEMTVP